MVDKFVGTWKMTTSDNFDEYMKAIGIILHHLIIYEEIKCMLFSKSLNFVKCKKKSSSKIVSAFNVHYSFSVDGQGVS